jgi:hypothetical protein
LADELDKLHQYVPSEAPAMIRRLVEELDKQGEPVAWWNGKSKFCSPRDKSWDAKTGGILSFGCNIPLYTTPQTKPLSDEEILNSWVEIDLPEECWITDEHLINFAKAIEERHGIK